MTSLQTIWGVQALTVMTAYQSWPFLDEKGSLLTACGNYFITKTVLILREYLVPVCVCVCVGGWVVCVCVGVCVGGWVVGGWVGPCIVCECVCTSICT